MIYHSRVARWYINNTEVQMLSFMWFYLTGHDLYQTLVNILIKLGGAKNHTKILEILVGEVDSQLSQAILTRFISLFLWKDVLIKKQKLPLIISTSDTISLHNLRMCQERFSWENNRSLTLWKSVVELVKERYTGGTFRRTEKRTLSRWLETREDNERTN